MADNIKLSDSEFKRIAIQKDYEPVVYGRWISDGDFVICSQCEAEMNQKNSLGVDNSKNYCPNYGARMDVRE
jgi:hypothetical protein